MRSSIVAGFAVAVLLVAGAAFAYVAFGGDGAAGDEDSVLDQVNRKLDLHSQPTITSLTQEAPPTDSPGALSPTPVPTFPPPDCGEGAITGGAEIVAKYGEVRGCGPIGTLLVFTTYGVDGGPGGMGIFDCGFDDPACLRGEAPKTGGPWAFYPAPRPGGVKELALPSPNILIINNGGAQMCFDLVSREYILDPSCH